VGFAITTGAGADQTVEATTIQLEGVGWNDVRTLTLEGATSPLDLTWTDETTWQTIVPLEEGTHDVVLIATGHQGQEVGTDSIVVTRSGGG
jgi:hypothetical protein